MKKKKVLSPAVKAKRLEISLKNVLEQYILSKRYHPLPEIEIFKALAILPDQFEIATKAIKTLIKEEKITFENECVVPVKDKPIIGTLKMNPRGFGFVIPDNAGDLADIFIPQNFTKNGVDGDIVEVEIFDNPRSEKGPEGKITKVLTRAREHLAGIILQVHGSKSSAFSPLFGSSNAITVFNGDLTLIVGDRVILKIEEWGSSNEAPTARAITKIGNIAEPSVDVDAALEEFDIRSEFSKDVVAEAKSFEQSVQDEDYQDRVDLTAEVCVTIDPTTAKDYDDALSVTKDSKGNYTLLVHIADVAHYVQPGSALDLEAKKRCNSTYFPGKCVPMLPEELSNGLCSLKPDEKRLAVSVNAKFDKDGELLDYKIFRSVIQSQKRFTYDEAMEVLDGKKISPHLPMLEKMVELCLLLKQKRRNRGSIDFSMAELVVAVDPQGKPNGTYTVQYDITHQLVEEFMLKANELVATKLDSLGKPLLFRVHEEPYQESYQNFFILARALGFQVPAEPTQVDIQKLFEEAQKTPFAHQLSISFIRSMKLACYSSANVGHFGLALTHYTHFTSPIRRYTDLIIERLLFNEEVNENELNKVAQACSEQERLSFKAESSVKTLKKLRLLNEWIKENPQREFPAYISKLKPFGFHFEITELSLEGFLHVSELENDYFVHHEKVGALIGRHSGATYKLSTPLLVQVADIDLITQEIKWLLPKSPRKNKSRE